MSIFPRGNFDSKRMKARLPSLSERLFAVTARQSNCWRGGGSEGGRWKFRSDAPTSASSSHLGGRMRGGERIGNCRRSRKKLFFAGAGWDDAASGSPSPRQVDLSGYFRTSKTYLIAIYLRKRKLVSKRLVKRRTSK